MHWDAFQYLDQAAHGYMLFHCNLFGGLERWCGYAGWFPGYPWLIRVAGVDGFAAAMVLSWGSVLARRLPRSLAAGLADIVAVPMTALYMRNVLI